MVAQQHFVLLDLYTSFHNGACREKMMWDATETWSIVDSYSFSLDEGRAYCLKSGMEK